MDTMSLRDFTMKTRRSILRKSLAAMAIAAALFTSANARAEDGYIIKNGDSTQYSSLFAANPQNGDLVSVTGGDVTGGGRVTYTTSSQITLQSDTQNVVRKIDASGADRLFYSDVQNSELTLNIANLELTNGNTITSTSDNGNGGLIRTSFTGSVTINGNNASFTNSKAYSGGAIYAKTVNLNGSNTFSWNETQSSGGAICGDMINISGINTFTYNSAQHSLDVCGGAIYAYDDIVFKGKNSTATFSNNIVTVGSTQHMNDIYAEDNITIQDGGRYTFNGGITTAKPQEGVPPFQTFTIQDGSNVTFGTGSSTIINGTTKLDNAHLTIQGGASTTFNVGTLEIEEDSQNSIVFEHTTTQAGTVMEGTGLETLKDTPMIVKLDSTGYFEFAYVSEITDNAVTTTVVENSSAFGLVRDTDYVGGSSTMGGIATLQSGDLLVVMGDGTIGTAVPEWTSDLTLTIQSSKNDVRTIFADTQKILTGNEKITLNLSQIKFVSGNNSGTGALIDSKQVTINGSGEFAENDANGDNGGAISAVDTVTINGTIQIINDIAQTGLAFTNNKATAGGAISGSTVKISGSNFYVDDNDKVTYANTFTGNEASGGVGGAVYASGSVTLSGSNLFDKNASGNNGGAIASEGNVSITGVNTFTGNTARSTGDGGAIWAKDDVTFSGKDSTTTFSGNKAKVNVMKNGEIIYVNNDVYSQEGNISFNGGVHTLGGGLVANQGAINVSGDAFVCLQSGSISSAQNLTIDDDSMLKIDLNAKNKVSALNKTDVVDGATELFLTGTGTIGAESRMDVTLVKTAGMTNGYYLVAAGNFYGNDTEKVLFNTWDYEESRISATTSGLYVGVLVDKGVVSRSDASGTLNMADTFDGAFEDGLGAAATGNVITLGANVNAERGVRLGADVTELTIQSDDSAQQRTITATDTPQHRFLYFNGDATVNTSNITFQNGGNTNIIDINGGAIFAEGDLTVNGTTQVSGNATVFKNNKAEFGGALCAFIQSLDPIITLGGKLDFDGNSTVSNGGAVHSVGTVTLEGDSIAFKNNKAFSGGAIFTRDLVISGTDNSFTNNHADDEGGAIYATGDVTFTEGSVTNFSENTMGTLLKKTTNDLFVNPNLGDSSVIAIEKNATVNFGGGVFGNNNTTLVIKEGANVTFNKGTAVSIGGGIRIESDKVSFGENVEITLVTGLVVGAGITQKLQGKVNIYDQLGVTFDPQDGSFSSIDLSTANEVKFDEDTAVKIYDDAGNAMSAADFKGIKTTHTLVYGQSDWLKNVGGADSYQSLLYNVYIGMDGQDFVVKSEVNEIAPELTRGNTLAVESFYGMDLYDVPTEAELQQRVASYSRESIAHTGHAMVNKMSYMNQSLVGRSMPRGAAGDSLLRGQNCGLERNVWVSGYGLGASVQNYKGYSGYDYNAGGTLLGVDWQNSVAQFGLYFGYGQMDMDAQAANLNSDDVSFGSTLRWNDDWGYTSLLGGFQFNNIEGRNTLVGGPGEDLDFNAWEATVYAERGLKFENKLGGFVNPYAALQYISYRSDGFTHSDMVLSATELDSFQSILGLRLSHNARIAQRYDGNLSLGFAWRHEFLDAAQFVGTIIDSNSAVITGNMAGRDYCEFTVGVGVDLNSRVNVSGDYYLNFNRHSAMNAGMGTVTVKF